MYYIYLYKFTRYTYLYMLLAAFTENVIVCIKRSTYEYVVEEF